MAQIGIIETGRQNEQLARIHGSYPQILSTYFFDPGIEFRAFNVFDTKLPQPDACAGWIITGSVHAVYEPHPWIAPLMEFIRQAIALERPTLGICFGHQLMAQAFGGKVTKSPKGWGLGVHEYRATEAGLKRLCCQEHFQLYAVHQDQVTIQPPNSELLAGSNFCPHAVLAYGNSGLSFQSHPEYTADYERALIERVGGEAGPEITAAALASLDKPVHSQQMIDCLRQFLTRQACIADFP